MIDDANTHLPDHRVIVTLNNIEGARLTLPDDQQSRIEPGCSIWRMPVGVDDWAEPCGVTMTFWPSDQRGALHHDGSLEGSSWGTWHGDELWLDEGLAVNMNGRILRAILGENR